MSRTIIDEKGNVYGDLDVISFEEVRKYGTKGAYWLCKCKCGNKKSISGVNLRNGSTKTCGECSKQNYKIYSDYAEGKTKKGEYFKIDIEDLDKVSKHNWHLRHGYPYNSKLGALHNFLINKPDGLIVDHINGIITDNRRSNLRVVTKQLNNSNNHNTKGYIKIQKYNKYERYEIYRALVVFKGKKYHLGYYDTKEEASKAHFDKKAELFNAELESIYRQS